MDKPPIPYDEQSRLAALKSLGLLDTPAEERFDRYTRLAQKLFHAPIAAISLVDDQRQWFKSMQGLDVQETSRDVAFCAHAITDDEIFAVDDASTDPRFADNPLVTGDPNIRFYAGYPLKDPNGHNVGTLCIIDTEPRYMTEAELSVLADLGDLVNGELETLALATTDALTGICNRRGFEALSHQALSFCARNEMPVSVLMIDLDLFKSINDEWGHAEGDAALCGLAAQLVKTFRDSDVVGRLGGDEFAVLLSGTAGDQAQIGASRLTAAVDEFNRSSGSHWKLQFSVGISELEGYLDRDLHAAIRRADEQMYAHKRARRLRRMAV